MVRFTENSIHWEWKHAFCIFNHLLSVCLIFISLWWRSKVTNISLSAVFLVVLMNCTCVMTGNTGTHNFSGWNGYPQCTHQMWFAKFESIMSHTMNIVFAMTECCPISKSWCQRTKISSGIAKVLANTSIPQSTRTAVIKLSALPCCLHGSSTNELMTQRLVVALYSLPSLPSPPPPPPTHTHQTVLVQHLWSSIANKCSHSTTLPL